MKKKKLAFILPGLESGGAERVVSILANELCEKYEVIIITLWNVEPFYYLHEKILHIKCSNRTLISKNIFQALRNNFYLLKRLNFIIRENKVDVAIGFTTTANILTSMVSKRNNIPCLISERSNPNSYTLNSLWSILRNYTYKDAAFLIVQTAENKEIFKKVVPLKNIKVLANPLSNELILKKKKLPRENIILNVGRLDKNKSQDLLIKAFSNVNNQNWKLVFIGDGIEKNNYFQLAKRLGIADKVTLVGNTKNVFDYYNSSKIFAFTSKSEGFPNVLIEAMYFSLPCISTNCPSGPSEIIDDTINGFLIPVSDQNALQSKLEILMASEDLRYQIGKRAHLKALNYKTENIVLQWDLLINKIVK